MGDSVASSKKSKKGAAAPVADGEFMFQDGSIYTGEFVTEGGVKKRDGTGTFKSTSESYTGSWKADMQEGEGEYRFSSGALYVGSFSKGAFHGHGRYTFPDGAFYEGEWNMSKMHGKGSFTDAKQVTYSGDFYNGLYDNGKSFVSMR